MFLFFAALTAHAQITWQSSYANGNLKQWSQVQCGGQGTTCPCAPPSNPSGAANYTEGSCSTNSTGQFPQPTDGSGRYQLVTPPAGRSGTALKINLQHNDYWLTNWTRNEVLGPQETAGVATYYGDGDDRYFAWSTWFDPTSFASFNCGSSACTSNPWNVFTQFHQAGDNYSTPMSFVLRASSSQPGKYQMQYLTRDKYDNADANEHIQYKWDTLPTGVWNDFVLHVHFGTSASTGLVELWYGVNGGTKTQLTLACPDSSGVARNLTSCPTTTLYIWPAPGDYNYYPSETYSPRTPGTAMPVILKQGLYRQNDILDNVNLYHTDMVIGKTLADVSGGGTQPPPAQLTVTTPLAFSPASPAINQSTTATYTVQNTGSQAITVQYFHVGARDPSNANVDFPASVPVTLQPGQQYNYSGSESFATAGTYSAWPSYYDGTNWFQIATPTSFAVQGTSSLFSDNFNRTTGLGANWSVFAGSFTTDGSMAVAGTMTTSGTGNWAKVAAALGTNNYSVAADIIVPAGSLDSGLVARSNDSVNFDSTLYSAQIATDGHVNLYRRNAWNWTLLSSVATTITAGTSYNLKLITTGSSPVHLEVWLNGVQKIVFNDSSTSQIATGSVGMINYDTSVKYDNFTVTAQ
jgi:hypothetical protein